MKKTLSILLAVVLMFAMAIPVFAEDVSSDDVSGETTKDVTATLEEGNVKDVATVYYVTVAWDVQSELKYTLGDTTYTWNPADTEYKMEIGEAEWSGEATVEITITNKSNAEITAAASWAGEAGLTTACDFKGKASVTVGSADENTDLTADEKVLNGSPVTDTISGSVTVSAGSITENNATVGTVTLSISK